MKIEKSQIVLIERYLDWNLVQSRLNRYPHLKALFPFASFQKAAATPPFYCHGLAWRLGTWKNEKLFDHLEALLKEVTSIPNWDNKIKNDPSKPGYESFWSTVWEWQVAKHLKDLGLNPEWIPGNGPDLKILAGSQAKYVECYVPQKSFGARHFIDDMFLAISHSIKTSHISLARFALPSQDMDKFLDRLFKPFLNDVYLSELLMEAEKEYPVLIPVPNGATNFVVYVTGENPSNYVAGRIPQGAGDETDYLRNLVEESLENKSKQGSFSSYQPIVLAINFLLTDYQKVHFRNVYWEKVNIEIPINNITGILGEACGINEEIKSEWPFSYPDKSVRFTAMRKSVNA